jgi:hypothetical protein
MLVEDTGAGVERSLAAAAVAVKGDASRRTSMALVSRPKLNPRRRIPRMTERMGIRNGNKRFRSDTCEFREVRG